MAAKTGGKRNLQRIVYVFDRREGDSPEVSISLNGLSKFPAFQSALTEVFSIGEDEEFVIVTTERIEINESSYGSIEGGETLYILLNCDQDLSAPVLERVEFLPHYDTLTKSGMYEYYASEGQNPLPFAFAELLDNALYATSTNSGVRKIEIRLMFDDTTNHNSVCVLDNGMGMNSKELNEWAVYRLSKHNRSKRKKAPDAVKSHVPRSLNSDISYFGVGGKQAIFFIGNSTRMISKCIDSNDVHEMILSKDEFKEKEKNKEAIYSGTIFNRMACDVNHVLPDDKHLCKLIEEEKNEKSFTKVFITSVQEEHVTYLKSNFMEWCRELAHIYHYYLHGPNGNTGDKNKIKRNIEISVSLFDKGRTPKHLKLVNICEDIQSQYIRSASSKFDFKVECDGDVLEGQLRYHPFLYDRETYPINTNDNDKDQETTEDEELIQNIYAPRGDRPIFGCYWNGRLIPYTTIKSFDWCENPRKRTALPMECYNRFSGVLWADDAFKVSTNKLTFMDLELKLSDRSAAFTRVISGQDQRIPITKAFNEWLKFCHETYDKQIRFFDNKGPAKRTDLSGKRNLTTWTAFNSIEWHGSVYTKGNYVKTVRTSPMIIGSINRFFLNGEYKDNEVFMTGGEVEIIQEPSSLYGEKRIFPLDKLDRFFQQKQASDIIKAEELKLPCYLTIEWPEGNELKEKDVLSAGAPIGAMKIDIMNGKHESINKIPGSQGKRLLVELKVVGTGGKNKDVTVIQHTCQHGGKSWPYWFRKMENINALGEYMLCLTVLLADTSGSKTLKRLPYHEIRFTVSVGKPYKFNIDRLDTAIRSGVAFKMHLNVMDYYGNITAPVKVDGSNIIISVNDEQFEHGDISIKDHSIVVNDVVGYPKVDRIDGRDLNIKVVYLYLDENSQHIKARFLPGLSHSLDVKPSDDVLEINNGSPVRFNVVVRDQAGNMTAEQKGQVNCKLTSSSGKMPSYAVDCSSGKGVFAIPSIDIKNLRKDVTVNVKFEMPYRKSVECVKRQIKVLPGVRPASLEVQLQLDGADSPAQLTDGEEVICGAGDTITGITFKICDEGGRALTVDDGLASKVKVNWATKIPKDKVTSGVLPSIKVPCSVSETKFCQVTCNSGAPVEFTFTLKPQAKTAHSLHCKYIGINKVSPDHPKIGMIIEVQDCYGNRLPMVKEDTKEIDISGDGIDVSPVKREVNSEGNFLLNDILFDDLTPGNREITFEYKGLTAYQRVDVLAGPPTSIKYLNQLHDQVIPVRNGQKWDGSIHLQVVDSAGHACKDANIQISLKCDGNMKFIQTKRSTQLTQISMNTDKHGQANFSDFILQSPSKHGEFKISPRAQLGKNEIKAPPLVINLLADPNKAVKILNTFSMDEIVAGDLLPEIKCCVYAEDDNVMTNIEPSSIMLKIWTTNNKTKANPNKTMMYHPNELADSDDPYYFYFRDLKAPTTAGKCYISTQYKGNLDGKEVVLPSEMSYIQILHRKPVKIVPLNDIPTPTVSNTQGIQNRTLIKNYPLNLVDEYNNICTQVEKGVIKIHIETGDFEIPPLNEEQTTLEFPLVGGECSVDHLFVPDGCVGRNEQQYRLLFEPLFNESEKDENIEPHVLPFLFYNDGMKQKQMSHRLKERDKLAQTINTYKLLFKTTRQLIKEMNVSVEETSKLILKVKNLLRTKGEDIENLASIPYIRKRIHLIEKEIINVKSRPQRKCAIVPAERHALIIGKVAHLAEVEDDDVARVLSWHMSGDMDCIVTLNTAKAKDVYKQSNGHQQVLPMDSIYRKNLSAWDKDLPHRGLSGVYKGNPVYARHLLKITENESNVKTVFSMLLGDTIIIDDLDCANEYRLKLVKYCYCPTILTRSGERIRSNGKFGGSGNKAPAIEKLRGHVFPAPMAKEVDDLTKTIELLQQLEEAMNNNDRAKDELELQVAEGRSEQMQLKYRECVDAEKRLSETEQELGMTPSSHPPSHDPMSLLNEENGTGEDEEVPSEKLLKTIHQEVGNSIRISNTMKRKSSSDVVGDETPSDPRRARNAGKTSNSSDKRKAQDEAASHSKRSSRGERSTRNRANAK